MKRKLSPADKEAIVAEIQAKTATMKQLATKFSVSQGRISQVFKNMTGSALHPHWRYPEPGRGNGSQEVVNWSHMNSEDQEISLREVLSVVVKLCKEHPGYPCVIEINLKDQIVSIR